ncbi:MAG: bifunctional metallophosphatase/5'-nucleotidase, partial [Burkholderiales bacterium]|nr:bifunctional metallophosphatase/5'-nucleotidase [Burkholderiales bacterium]
MRITLLASLICSSLVLAACNSVDTDTAVVTPVAPVTPPTAAGTKLDLAVLQTTDLHANVLSYDYYKTTDDTTLGFERTATLIDTARKENPNN